MLGSPKPPGSNMLLGGMESSLQSVAVVESPSFWCANTTPVTTEFYSFVQVQIAARQTTGKGTL